MPKKNVILIFLRKKADFLAIFRLFTASVRSRPPGPSAVPGVLIFCSHSFDKFTVVFQPANPTYSSHTISAVYSPVSVLHIPLVTLIIMSLSSGLQKRGDLPNTVTAIFKLPNDIFEMNIN